MQIPWVPSTPSAPRSRATANSYTQLGDRTVASMTLFAATALLPLLMLGQAWRSGRRREGLVQGRVNQFATLFALQWCVVLAAWGMLPFALWR